MQKNNLASEFQGDLLMPKLWLNFLFIHGSTCQPESDSEFEEKVRKSWSSLFSKETDTNSSMIHNSISTCCCFSLAVAYVVWYVSTFHLILLDRKVGLNAKVQNGHLLGGDHFESGYQILN